MTQSPEPRAVVVLRPIATPLPLTFAGLLIASLVLSGYELGWIPHAQHVAAGLVLLAVPLPMQLLSAFEGFAARSATAATGGGILAVVWIALGLDLVHRTSSAPGPSDAAGMLALGAAAALLAPALAELRTGALLAHGIVSAAALRLVLTALAGLTHDTAWVHASGWFGLVVAAVALYGAVALDLEGALGREALPTLRVGLARDAVEGDAGELARSPGVRRTL
jgi:succinate-acetate transporter protein